jgi:hypothetical protein
LLTIFKTRRMKTMLVLGLVAVISVGVVLTLWKPASIAPTNQSGATPFEQAALEQTAESPQESLANETIAPGKSAFARRRAPVHPQVQNDVNAADLLVQIQAALASKNFGDREIVFTNLLAQLVRTDPFAAAQFAETNSIGHTHDQVLQRVARLWAASDPSAALNWAITLNNPAEREAILTEVCLQVAERDPAEAVRMRSQWVTDEKPNGGLEALTQRWAERDLPAALDWALSRAAGEQRDLLIARLALVQSQTSPIEAATLVAEKIPAGRAQTEAAMAVLNQWASHDMPAAGQWVARFPEGDLQARGFRELGSIARFQSAGQPR